MPRPPAGISSTQSVRTYWLRNQECRVYRLRQAWRKSLWASSAKQGDTAAVFAETAIDAISYAQLHPDPHTRYFSTGGALNPYQPDLIKAAVKRMPEGSIIIIAADHDEGGDRFTSTILKALEDNQSHIVERYSPEIEGMDWNDIVNNPISTPQLNIA